MDRSQTSVHILFALTVDLAVVIHGMLLTHVYTLGEGE